MMNLKDDSAGAGLLSVDEVAIIFSFLPPESIMRARVCTTWRDAATKTIVPLSASPFCVWRVNKYNLMRVMTTALPNLQQISVKYLVSFRNKHKYYDGEDAEENREAVYYHRQMYDINIISDFSKLRSLSLDEAPLNGRYPALFNFPLLQRLTISYCNYLKIDLEMLTGLPLLKELSLYRLPKLTGNLNNLRPLKDSLESIFICNSRNVSGNLMDLADFPHLKNLILSGTSVTGDVRDIRTSDFPSASELLFPRTVVGGACYMFQSIYEVPSFMQAIHALMHRIPAFRRNITWRLSKDSPDWYDRDGFGPRPPLTLQVVKAGPRLGWTWFGEPSGIFCDRSFYCEINWLDPEPISEGSDYEIYVEELQRIEKRIDVFKGHYEPPTEEEFRRMCEEYMQSRRAYRSQKWNSNHEQDEQETTTMNQERETMM